MEKPTPEDILSIPNAISVVGLTSIAYGAPRIDTPRGLLAVATGKALDLVDGIVARRTGQTSPFGAAVDATVDKAGTAIIFYHCWRRKLVPTQVAAAILIQNSTNAVLTAVTEKRHPDRTLAPSRAGKNAMFAQAFVPLLFGASKALEENHPKASKVARQAGYISAILGIGMGVVASAGYAKRLK